MKSLFLMGRMLFSRLRNPIQLGATSIIAIACQASVLGADLPASQGFALCIGINQVDATRYQTPVPLLTNAENDATSMDNLASVEAHFPNHHLLLGKNATHDAVVNELRAFAGQAKPGDIFLFSFAGHGTYVPDSKTAKGYVVSYCLYDLELLDSEVHNELAKFQKDVRIIAFSDCCHSGSIVNLAGSFKLNDESFAALVSSQKVLKTKGENSARELPPAAARKAYLANKDTYDQLVKAQPVPEQASIISITACND